MNQVTISKSKLKSRLSEILREIERSRNELVITSHGRPILKILPYSPQPSETLNTLRGSVLEYIDPTEPVEASGNGLT